MKKGFCLFFISVLLFVTAFPAAAYGRTGHDRHDTYAEDEPAADSFLPDNRSEDGETMFLAGPGTDYGYTIVIPVSDPGGCSFAAGILQSAIASMTGQTVPVVTDEGREQSREIRIGETGHGSLSAQDIGKGGFILRTEDDSFCILASDGCGAQCGVLAYLRDYCGCRCFDESGLRTPENTAVTVPVLIDKRENTYFSYTEAGSGDLSFMRCNALTGGCYAQADVSSGGAVQYVTGSPATLTTLFVNAQSYYESDPTWFALQNGKRSREALCLSNDAMYEVLLSEASVLLRQRWTVQADRTVLVLGQADSEVVCSCGKCSAVNARNGGRASGTLTELANRLQKDLTETGFSGISVEIAAVGAYREVPTSSVPADGVSVRIDTADRCCSHALTNGKCGANKAIRTVIEDWTACCSFVTVDIPTENRVQTIGIFPDFAPMQEDIRYLYESGVRGVCAVDSEAAADCGEEFRALRSYLFACLLRDPYTDITDIKNEYLRLRYGESSTQINKILDIFSRNAGDRDGHLYTDSLMTDTFRLTQTQIDNIDALWTQARASCEDGGQLLRTENSMLAWRYWKACCEKSEFSGKNARSACLALLDDLQKAGVTAYSLTVGSFDSDDIAGLLHPQNGGADGCRPAGAFLQKAVLLPVGLSLLTAFALLLFGIRQKNILYYIPLPGIAVMTVLLPWHDRCFAGESLLLTVLSASAMSLFACTASVCSVLTQSRFLTPRERRSDLLSGIAVSTLPLLVMSVWGRYMGTAAEAIHTVGLFFAYGAVCVFALQMFPSVSVRRLHSPNAAALKKKFSGRIGKKPAAVPDDAFVPEAEFAKNAQDILKFKK